MSAASDIETAYRFIDAYAGESYEDYPGTRLLDFMEEIRADSVPGDFNELCESGLWAVEGAFDKWCAEWTEWLEREDRVNTETRRQHFRHIYRKRENAMSDTSNIETAYRIIDRHDQERSYQDLDEGDVYTKLLWLLEDIRTEDDPKIFNELCDCGLWAVEAAFNKYATGTGDVYEARHDR